MIENAPHNLGAKKVYEGVAANLVAFTCLQSIKAGFDGYVSFYSKSNLIKHYEEKLGAVHQGSQLMIIFPPQALNLVEKYFKFGV